MTANEIEIDRVLRFRPPRIAAALCACGIAVHWIVPLKLHEGLALPALLLASAGFLLMLRAWWLFRRADTAICPADEPTTFVAGDVYRLTRNPMYVGMVLMLAAAGVATGGVAGYLAATLFWAILDRHFVPFEESRLQQAFGIAYTVYRQRVRRWL